MITDLLAKLEEEKDQWMYEAIDHFNEVFLRFDGQIYEKNQVLIGVYGPTQIEKVTLMLKLLGIGDEQIEPLSQALLSKNENGKSPVITSFLLKWSSDQNFYLIFPDKTMICCVNLKELETALQTIRKQTEGREISYDKPIILKIARQFFTDNQLAYKSESISVIDLPGDDTMEKLDEQYVDHILTTYMPFCSVCLVMENSSELVRPFQVVHPTVKDWIVEPQKFWLVLTQCLQSSSVQSAIASGDIASVEDFLSYYQYLLNRNDVEIPNKIFPLEFGGTWLELKQKNSPIFQKSKDWINQLFLELLDSATAVKTPENQIMQIKNIEHSICKQKKLNFERMEKEYRLIKERLQEDQQNYENLVSASHYLQEEIGFCETELKNIDRIRLEEFTCDLYEKFTFDDKKDQVVFKERKKSKLMESFQMVEKEMLEFYKDQTEKNCQSLKQIIQRITPSATLDFQTDPPIEGLPLKHGRVLNQYLKRGTFEEDYSIVLDTLEKNNTIVYNYYFSQLNHFIQHCKKELLQLWNTKKEHYRLADDQVKEKLEQKRQKEASLIEIQEKLVWAKRERNQDLVHKRLLDEILKEEFVKAVDGWKEKMFSDRATDAERWAYHLYCQVILKQAERIIGNDYI
ncbi:hypothetical protein [Bacillus sp. EB600]|uniref:hypothetical protein n=1 Tax=Bacillus sp. EB600 TaxID=2806345 RepID=UPI00210CAF30|nr:hypothetical protein [Bacillus sp. EB600]MCQ6279344.1 hypothetical protein [Bacillus sp. EB600]